MEDSLVGRRSKRSTAGNRMEAALAEMNVDDLMQDIEEDIDFVSKVDEEDVFESDFASTDEDEGKDDDEAGERVLQDEEKRAKRAARQKVFKVPKPPARKVTFDSPGPDGEQETPGTKPKSKPQRRVSLGQVVDAETGEVLETNKRQSKREATRLNTQELQSRLKTAEDRKATITTRPKVIEPRKTQAELITAALDMEEDNIISHRDYLVTEEERRKKARVVKASTVGPKIRWTSRVEEVTVTVYDPVVAPQQISRPTWTSPYAPAANTAGQPQISPAYINPYNIPSGQPAASASSAVNTATAQPNAATQYPYTYVAASNARPASINAVASTSKQSSTATPTPATTQHYTNQYYPYQYYTPSAPGQTQPYQQYGQYYTYQPQGIPPHLQLHPQGQPQTIVPRKATEKQVKNYVEHLVDEERPQDKPTWRESMEALFGTHVDWDNVRVYVGKNRPFGRQTQSCPITGIPARYLDPRTGVPYANSGAYKILTRLLQHEYVWSPSAAPGAIGVFVGHEKQRGAIGVPVGWGEAMGGVEDNWRKKRVDGRKEEKAKEKEKEVRVGGRRSSRIAAEGGETGDKELMDVDTNGDQNRVVETGISGQNEMDAEPALRES